MPGFEADDVTIAWCCDGEAAEMAAALFVEHAESAYISHSELQSGRASGVGTWADDLDSRIRATFRRAAEMDRGTGPRLATMTVRSVLAGVALVAFVPDAPRPYAVLEDLLIAAPARGRGLGERVFAWLENECRQQGIDRLFLESGATNHRAHAFFARHGFRQTSIVMMRDL